MMIGDFKNISNLIQKYVKIILKTIKNNIQKKYLENLFQRNYLEKLLREIIKRNNLLIYFVYWEFKRIIK